MAEPTKSAKATGEKPAAPKTGAKDWKALLYTEDRVKKWAKGEMTLAELDGISGPEMLEMAVTGFAMYEQGRYREAKVIFDGLAALDPKESYYRTALDHFGADQDKARSQLVSVLEQIRAANQLRANSLLTNTFFDTKASELISIFRQAAPADKQKAYNLLVELDPTKADRYRAITE